MDLVARAEALAALLKGGGVLAFADPEKAYNNRPCLLVAPPVLDWTEGTLDGTPQVQWPILALSGREVGTLDAVQELGVLIARADAVLDVEKASPSRYQLNSKTDPVPAYLCIHTEIEEPS